MCAPPVLVGLGRGSTYLTATHFLGSSHGYLQAVGKSLCWQAAYLGASQQGDRQGRVKGHIPQE